MKQNPDHLTSSSESFSPHHTRKGIRRSWSTRREQSRHRKRSETGRQINAKVISHFFTYPWRAEMTKTASCPTKHGVLPPWCSHVTGKWRPSQGLPLPFASWCGCVTCSHQGDVNRSHACHIWVRAFKEWLCLLCSHIPRPVIESRGCQHRDSQTGQLGAEQLGKQKLTVGWMWARNELLFYWPITHVGVYLLQHPALP